MRARLLLALLVCGPSAGYAQNLLQNPDFGSVITPWLPTAGTISVTRVASPPDYVGGTGEAQVTHSGAAFDTQGMSQCVPVTGSTLYEVSGYLRIPSGQSVNNHSARLGGEWFQNANCTTSLMQNFSDVFIFPSDGENTWIFRNGTGSSPTMAQSFLFKARINKLDATAYTAL
ncbi:MAG TPA: hypothetical protein VGR00_02770, partial [Thermoanaerobaculia bacterium]|nr:hypothetical protein [Thermoanaerobaculia bacterium]